MTNKSSADPGGYRELLDVAVPLILSTGSLTMMLFMDRMFLAWHSTSAVAAAVPGGITYFTICCLFMGTAQYVNSIVAQNHGAGHKRACARAVTQGILFSVVSIPLILLCIPFGQEVLRWAGHGPELLALEHEYFKILMFGGTILPINAALSSFFSGRGKTRIVMWGNLAGNLANIVLDYLLIFGNFGFPEMGIRGAAIATATTNAVPTLYWLGLFLSKKYQSEYKTRRSFVWDRELFSLLIRYGAPSGVQFFLDVAAFTVFVLLIGRLGEANLAASNIVLCIEMLVFLPMTGMSIATSTLVGEYIGRGKLEIAEKSVSAALRLSLLYTGIWALLFLFTPKPFLNLFTIGGHAGADLSAIIDTAMILIKFIACYTLFDVAFIIYSGALKGAGDTKFAMWAQIIIAWGLFAAPVYIGMVHFNWGLYTAWACVLFYVVVLGTVFWLRFRAGKWKTLSLIAG
jgi:multidrug resistance protein, MATE family